MRLFRTLVIFELGAWVGTVTSAALAKRAMPSRGDEESDEVALMAIFDGIDLKSRAQAFRGGSMFAWFGGVDVKVPREWRIVATGRAFAGGVSDAVPEPADPDAPTLVVESTAALGGISIRAAEAPAPDAVAKS
jgi:hypothetical protein